MVAAAENAMKNIKTAENKIFLYCFIRVVFAALLLIFKVYFNNILIKYGLLKLI